MLKAQPNGSRLSCGASPGGRKRPELRDLLAGAQTYASSKSRPRQLQALVRRLAGAEDFVRSAGRWVLAGAVSQAKTKPTTPNRATPPKARYTLLGTTAPPFQDQCSYEQQCAEAEEKQEEHRNVFPTLSQRRVEGCERDEQSAYLPHTVFDAFAGTLHTRLVRHRSTELVWEEELCGVSRGIASRLTDRA